jgi:hypothetical protein
MMTIARLELEDQRTTTSAGEVSSAYVREKRHRNLVDPNTVYIGSSSPSIAAVFNLSY